MSELNPITRKEMFLAAAAGQNIDLPTPITRKEMFLAKIAEGAGTGGGTGGAGIKHEKFEINFLPSDFVDARIDSAILKVTEEKNQEIVNMMAELSSLKPLLVNLTVNVNGIGEMYRLPMFFKTKNENAGAIGSLSSITSFSYSLLDDGYIDDITAISLHSSGISVVPHETRLGFAQMGGTLTIDALYM